MSTSTSGLTRQTQLLSIALALALSGVAVAQAPVTLAEAYKAPAKFTTQKACWLGRQVGAEASAIGASDKFELKTTHWMGLDEKQNPLDLFFFVDEKSATWSNAAVQSRGTETLQGFVACGVITGAEEAKLYLNSKTRAVRAPILTGASIDLPKAK